MQEWKIEDRGIKIDNIINKKVKKVLWISKCCFIVREWNPDIVSYFLHQKVIYTAIANILKSWLIE